MSKNNTISKTTSILKTKQLAIPSITTPKRGKLPYRLINDYLFRAVFQTRPKALEGLCRSILHLSPKDKITVTLRNPIELGKKLEDKEFILDLAVVINDSLFLNLEMQAYSQAFWVERSLSYICRSFDNLNHGDSYGQVLPVIHIGFLNFTLFPKCPEFFADYQLINTKNHQKYSDKLRISVVDLTKIELATEEDMAYGIDLWARIFKATTWEEIEMLSQNNEYLQEAVSGVAHLTEDEQIRQLCQAREDFEYWERIRNAAHQRELDVRDAKIAKVVSDNLQKEAKIMEQQHQIAEQQAELNRLRTLLKSKEPTD